VKLIYPKLILQTKLLYSVVAAYLDGVDSEEARGSVVHKFRIKVTELRSTSVDSKSSEIQDIIDKLKKWVDLYTMLLRLTCC
jgi:hypothetical protein